MKGKCWRFGDHVDTDQIIPARYLNTIDPKELAAHCMEDADADFPQKVRPGDIIVAGENFGCGSSREHAPISLKGAGISCVVAKSFARIFFRNAINIGLPIAECYDAAHDAVEGDDVEVDFTTGRVTNHTQGKQYEFAPFPDQLQSIIDAGGLVNYAKSL